MHKCKQNNSLVILVIVLSCCLAVLVALAIWLHIRQDPSIPPTDTVTATDEQKLDSIAIPGYELLELQAGKKKQTVCLPNPEQNMCFFQISLFLEDGTLLWESELIKPGKNSKPIVLTEALAEGTYPNAILRYSCYRIDQELTPLNGAEIKVTLRVK